MIPPDLTLGSSLVWLCVTSFVGTGALFLLVMITATGVALYGEAMRWFTEQSKPVKALIVATIFIAILTLINYLVR